MKEPIAIQSEADCVECKERKPIDRLIKCTRPDSTFPGGEEVEYLCGDCLDKSIWYCHHCGQFCAGITSFEFGAGAGFCDNCWDQIQDSDYDGEDYEDDDYDPNFDESEPFENGSLDY